MGSWDHGLLNKSIDLCFLVAGWTWKVHSGGVSSVPSASSSQWGKPPDNVDYFDQALECTELWYKLHRCWLPGERLLLLRYRVQAGTEVLGFKPGLGQPTQDQVSSCAGRSSPVHCSLLDRGYDNDHRLITASCRAFTVTAVAQLCLLGTTWIFGCFQFGDSPAISYIFTILNSLQGVLLFVMHCLLYKPVCRGFCIHLFENIMYIV